MVGFTAPLRRTLVGVGAASAALAASSSHHTFYADERPSSRQKLSIYPSPTPDVLLVEEHTDLEYQIGQARKAVTQAYREGHAQVQGAINRWIGVEEAVEKQVKEIIPADEPLNPGILYVGVATLTGSIIGRNRALPIRVFLPPTLLLLSLNHFLPKTSHNLNQYFTAVERRHFPAGAEQHQELNKKTSELVQGLRAHLLLASRSLNTNLERGVSIAESRTGLKVREAVGFSHAVSDNIAQKAQDVNAVVADKVDTLKDQVAEVREKVQAEAVPKAKEQVAAVDLDELVTKAKAAVADISESVGGAAGDAKKAVEEVISSEVKEVKETKPEKPEEIKRLV